MAGGSFTSRVKITAEKIKCQATSMVQSGELKDSAWQGAKLVKHYPWANKMDLITHSWGWTWKRDIIWAMKSRKTQPTVGYGSFWLQNERRLVNSVRAIVILYINMWSWSRWYIIAITFVHERYIL